MSGEAQHDDTLGEAPPAPSDRRALVIVGALVGGLVLLVACWVFWSNFRYYDGGNTREEYTRAKISTIESAVKDYKERHGEYPPSLAVLTERQDGLPGYLEKKDIIDEWGVPIRYDPKDLTRSGKPRIYTFDHDGRLISN
jgi:hypothetical protein